MTYEEMFARAKALLERADASAIPGHLAYQFNVTGEAAGDVALLADYSDGDDVSPWAAEAVAWAVEAGIFSAGDNSLAPRAYVTRAELAQALMNYCR